jgi:hypothetical protein
MIFLEFDLKVWSSINTTTKDAWNCYFLLRIFSITVFADAIAPKIKNDFLTL